MTENPYEPTPNLDPPVKGASAARPAGRRTAPPAMRFIGAAISQVLLGPFSMDNAFSLLTILAMLTGAEMETQLHQLIEYVVFGCLIWLQPVVYVFGIWLFGQTPGHWIVGMQVVNGDEQLPSFWQSLLRYVGYPPVWLVWLLVGASVGGYALISGIDIDSVSAESPGLNYIFIVGVPLLIGSATFVWILTSVCLIAFSKSRRGLHERLSGTRVVMIPGARIRRNSTDA